MNTTTALDTTPGRSPVAAGSAQPVRRYEHWLARLRSTSLDTELARGLAPAGRRLRAVRADQLRAEQHELADAWTAVLDDATSGLVHWTRMPVQRRAVVAAADLITALVAALRSRSASVRGVALAQLLLTDGTGPLYRRGRLDAALLETLHALDAA